MTSTNSDPGAATSNATAAARSSKVPITRKMAFFRANVNSADDEGISDFSSIGDNYADAAARKKQDSSSDTEGEDIMSEEENKMDSVAAKTNGHDENETKYIYCK